MRLGRLAWFLLATAGCSRQAAVAPSDAAILYSADLRGAVGARGHEAGGLARRATLVDRVRLTAPALVQVDAGDVAPAAGDEPGLDEAAAREGRARLALRAYRRMGVDATTPGERDLALGVGRWRALCEQAKVPVVAANLVDGTGRPAFPATRLVRAGGVSVGVFGILELERQETGAGGDAVVTDAPSAARAAVQSLRRQGASVIVGLFHVEGGLARARAIAAASAGVDLVVLGHGGTAAPPQFVSAGERGRDLGRVDVRIAGGHASQVVNRVLGAGPDVPEQTGVRLLARAAEGPIASTFAESVAALSKAAGVRTYGEKWTYGSTSLCLGCHPRQGQQWQTTDHAHAYATLELAGKERDPACMGCHMTGFLAAGGAQNFESAAQFVNVGCEACHGPSARHVTSMDKRRGTSRTVDGTVCVGCHTPDQIPKPFNLAEALPKILGPGHGRPP